MHQFDPLALPGQLHQVFADIESLHFDNADIVSELSIPRIASLSVVPA